MVRVAHFFDSRCSQKATPSEDFVTLFHFIHQFYFRPIANINTKHSKKHTGIQTYIKDRQREQ